MKALHSLLVCLSDGWIRIYNFIGEIVEHDLGISGLIYEVEETMHNPCIIA